METEHFDSIIRGLTRSRSRRGALLSLIGGVAGFAFHSETSAKHRKKHKKKHRNGGSPPGSPPPVSPLPSPPVPTCSDGIRNGTETDIDCGGSCRRCADDRTCVAANDCISGTCPDGTCVACTPLDVCGSDANGQCSCSVDDNSGEPTCRSSELLGGLSVPSCPDCPAGTEVCVSTGNGMLRNCYKRCGS
jgi:hypothetical protein